VKLASDGGAGMSNSAHISSKEYVTAELGFSKTKRLAQGRIGWGHHTSSIFNCIRSRSELPFSARSPRSAVSDLYFRRESAPLYGLGIPSMLRATVWTTRRSVLNCEGHSLLPVTYGSLATYRQQGSTFGLSRTLPAGQSRKPAKRRQVFVAHLHGRRVRPIVEVNRKPPWIGWCLSPQLTK
jgi:hypothetical protein